MPLDFSPITFHSYDLAQAFHYMTPKEVFALRTLAWSLPEIPIVVNVGAGAGTSSLALVESRPDAWIYTVDICKGGPIGGMENEKNAFRGKLDARGQPLKLPHQILGDSKEVGAHWMDEEADLPRIPLDMLFIDGDHSYAGCLGDVNAWQAHLKPGGIIAFHDYERDFWPDVKRVVDALTGFTHLFTIDTIWAGRKNA